MTPEEIESRLHIWKIALNKSHGAKVSEFPVRAFEDAVEMIEAMLPSYREDYQKREDDAE